MSQNKKSIWSTIILVATILSLVVLIGAVITLAVGIPVAMEAAKQAAQEQGGATEDEINLAVTIAVATIVVVFVLTSILDILKIVGGFKFALQGKWGLFCIVMSILGAIGSVSSLISDISNKAATMSLVWSIISLVLDILLVVACFKHRQEIA